MNNVGNGASGMINHRLATAHNVPVLYLSSEANAPTLSEYVNTMKNTKNKKDSQTQCELNILLFFTKEIAMPNEKQKKVLKLKS